MSTPLNAPDPIPAGPSNSTLIPAAALGAALDHPACYDAVRRRDRRFDGVFFTGVTSTGIFCRPSCPARTPASKNVVFFLHAAAAGEAGFRPCRRCRPELAPGHPEWNRRADLTGRALAMISTGEADRLGVSGLARRLGVSDRHLRRELRAEVGTGPGQLMQSRRLTTARLLLDQTDLPVAEVGFAAGFRSVRRFNEAFRAAFDLTPSDVRRPGRRPGKVITLRLPGRGPLGWAGLHRYLMTRAVAGLEVADVVTAADGSSAQIGRYRRGCLGGWFELSAPLVDQPEAEMTLRCSLTSLDQLGAVVAQARKLADLDTDRAGVAQSLSDGDELLADRLAQLPAGLPALPHGIDPFEVAVRAVVGQQVSVAAATTTLGRLLDLTSPAHPLVGEPPSHAPAGTGPDDLRTDCGGPRTAPLRGGFPSADELLQMPLNELGMPTKRRQTLVALAEAAADSTIDLSPAADRAATTQALLDLPGIGPWTAGYIAMRGLGDPNGWPAGDLVLRQSVAPDRRKPLPAAELDRRANTWRPWRAYAAMTLWATNDWSRSTQPRLAD